jgi:Tfp pilus assembly protein PilN
MSVPRPNLARRPFVDSRPANVAAALLLLAAIALSAVSVRTVQAYLGDSRKTREEIARLRSQIDRLEASRREAEAKLARFDLDGMRSGAEEANELARLRSFSWGRFLTRLERTLPNDVRVATIGLVREDAPGADRAPGAVEDESRVSLSLVSQDPDGLPKVLRAFYSSPWFDEPTPLSEAGGEQGTVDGRSLGIDVLYRDREAKP